MIVYYGETNHRNRGPHDGRPRPRGAWRRPLLDHRDHGSRSGVGVWLRDFGSVPLPRQIVVDSFEPCRAAISFIPNMLTSVTECTVSTIIECLTDILRGEDSAEARKQSTLFLATREGAVVMAAVLVAAVVMVTVAVGMEDISSLGRGW